MLYPHAGTTCGQRAIVTEAAAATAATAAHAAEATASEAAAAAESATAAAAAGALNKHTAAKCTPDRHG